VSIGIRGIRVAFLTSFNLITVTTQLQALELTSPPLWERLQATRINDEIMISIITASWSSWYSARACNGDVMASDAL